MRDFEFAIGFFMVTVVGGLVAVTLGVVVIKTWISWFLALKEIKKYRESGDKVRPTP
jgi:hypothetical protein